MGFITVSLRMKVNMGFCGGDGGCGGGVVDLPSFLLLLLLPPSFLNMPLKVILPCFGFLRFVEQNKDDTTKSEKDAL